MTRTAAIKKAIADELDRRLALIDGSTDLRGIVLDVKISPDCLEPRAVIFIPSFERRKDAHRPIREV